MNITQLLHAVNDGHDGAWDRLVPAVYAELKRIARYRLARLSPGATVRTTELVHETYLQLVGKSKVSWENRRHFFGAVAQCMREILIDEARRRGRKKHGRDWQRVGFDRDLPALTNGDDELLALDEALTRLKAEDDLQHEIVLLRYFAGLNIEEVARALKVSPSTIDRNWRFARAWLRRELTRGAE